MSDAATVFWFPAAKKGELTSDRGMTREFEGLESAVRFVMEKLPEANRATAFIQTDSASIHFGDIERNYIGNKRFLTV